MSSMFVWGCCLGLLLRAGVSRVAREPFTTKVWTYPKYMLTLGVGFSCFDWAKRQWLTSICENEERLDHLKAKVFLDLLQTGEEMTQEKLLNELSVKRRRI